MLINTHYSMSKSKPMREAFFVISAITYSVYSYHTRQDSPTVPSSQISYRLSLIYSVCRFWLHFKEMSSSSFIANLNINLVVPVFLIFIIVSPPHHFSE